MHLFYTPQITENFYILTEDESKHCIKVLRLANGEIINLVDGKGGFYEAKIIDPNPKRCQVEIIRVSANYGALPYNLHIAIAPTKNIERFEWFLEKATEIGINQITPLYTSRSERRIVKHDRLEKIITSAVKQSLKAFHPILHPDIEFSKFVKEARDGQKFIAHCIDSPKQKLKLAYKPPMDAIILIGPEGDFSPEEVRLANSNSYFDISLGDNRLRTETAGVVACHTIYLLNEI